MKHSSVYVIIYIMLIIQIFQRTVLFCTSVLDTEIRIYLFIFAANNSYSFSQASPPLIQIQMNSFYKGAFRYLQHPFSGVEIT